MHGALNIYIDITTYSITTLSVLCLTVFLITITISGPNITQVLISSFMVMGQLCIMFSLAVGIYPTIPWAIQSSFYPTFIS